MSGRAVRVVRPGLLTTVQDSGRWGYQSLGVPVAGPMDWCSHRAANALVGNDAHDATLEATLAGPTLEFEDDRLVAVVGARFDVTVDDREMPIDRAVGVAAGSTLVFGERIRGARAYVAVSGGFATPPVLGSRATHLPTGMGGLGGRALRAGDRLPLGAVPRRHAVGALRIPAVVPDASGHVTVRVVPGPQDDHFAPDALAALQSGPYIIASDSNRMGFRLEGPRVAHSRGANITSDATPIGSLQVPASGRPILLMADRQTTGGYPKLATVISADIPLAGQLGPGDAISFVACSLRDALAALIGLERSLMAIETAR